MQEQESASDDVVQASVCRRQQWLIMIALCVVTFLGAMIFATQAPFYPAAAESKGATPSEYGFVMGSFGLTQFIIGPFVGLYLHKIGVRNAFHGGVAVAASSTMAFGFLIFLNDRVWFLVLSFFLRVVEASGAQVMVVAVYTMAATDFPGSVARSFAIVETVYGLGMTMGPPVGVALYSVDGFLLPFLALGITHFLSGGFAYIALRKSKEIEKTTTTTTTQTQSASQNSLNKNTTKDKKVGILAVLKVPAVFLFAASIIASILTANFITSMLEPNLRQFDLSPTMFAFMFLLMGLTQALFSIVWGVVCDRIARPEMITLLGTAFLTLSAFLIGPFYWLPVEPNLLMTGASLVSLGLGVCAILVSAFSHGITEAKNAGFPADKSTSGLVSGIFSSCISLGGFTGPLIGGVLFENFGFRLATSMLCIGNSLMVIVFAIFVLTKSQTPKPSSKEQLEEIGECNAANKLLHRGTPKWSLEIGATIKFL